VGQQIDQDLEHLRLLKWGYYVIAALTAFGCLIPLVVLGMMAAVASGSLPAQQVAPFPSQIFGLVLVTIAAFILILGGGTAGLSFYVARCLETRRHRVLCVVVACLCCLQIPWGTILGVFTIIVLERPSVRALFEG